MQRAVEWELVRRLIHRARPAAGRYHHVRVGSPGPTSQQIRTDSGAVTALVLGPISLIGLVFPPLLALGIAAIVLGWTSRRRIARSAGALRGSRIAAAGLAFGVLGSLFSLVLPGFVIGVYIYAAFGGNVNSLP
jgi:hypothetical protein